jgi:hypothetical protein
MQTPLPFEQTLALGQVVLSTLPLLSITLGTLLLL